MESRSSPSRTLGVVCRKVTILGVEYLLNQPAKVRTAADEEAFILSRRADTLAAMMRAASTLSPAEKAAWRRDYINAMLCGIASSEEWSAYFTSLWRLAFRFWSALDPEQKAGRSLIDGVEWAYSIVNMPGITKEELDSLDLSCDIVSQQQDVGESSGSSETTSPPTADLSTAAGQP